MGREQLKLCVDTRYLLALIHRKDSQIQILEQAEKGNFFLVLPMITIAEFAKIARKFINQQETLYAIETIIAKFNSIGFSGRILGLSSNIATKAGELMYQQGLSLGDSIVASTGILTQCKYVLTDDPHFDRVKVEIKQRFRF
jgi:predicted nucleic acid-binding protein